MAVQPPIFTTVYTIHSYSSKQLHFYSERLVGDTSRCVFSFFFFLKSHPQIQVLRRDGQSWTDNWSGNICIRHHTSFLHGKEDVMWNCRGFLVWMRNSDIKLIIIPGTLKCAGIARSRKSTGSSGRGLVFWLSGASETHPLGERVCRRWPLIQTLYAKKLGVRFTRQIIIQRNAALPVVPRQMLPSQ